MMRPDVVAALAPLKGFQRATVDYAFERLYLAKDSTRRFLVADEVGLGKTLVARGVIARAIDHLWDRVKRIDVVYICSNADIARQNIRRLNPTSEHRFEQATRATMLMTVLKHVEHARLNFVSFTPGTSLEPQSKQGKAEERILLYHLLREAWGLEGKGALNLLQGGVTRTDVFRERIRRFPNETAIDRTLAERFRQALEKHGHEQRLRGEADIKERFLALSSAYARPRPELPREERRERAHLIGELRGVLARTSLRALEPDLVILDEFQRFKHLLAGEEDAAKLARELFDYADHSSAARVLLLSATPYKMYTLHHEAQEDDHYADFIRTVEFLEGGSSQHDLHERLAEYRRELYALGNGGGEKIVEVKEAIQQRLRRVMCRTERVGAGALRDGMLREVAPTAMTLGTEEVRSFLTLERVARHVGQAGTLEYWKSAPYLLNFMESYELKRAFREALERPDDARALAQHLAAASQTLLPWDEAAAYREVDPQHARLGSLVRPLLDADAWQLLWLPPSLPYYAHRRAFRTAADAGLTKRLVFSGWAVVPRAIAALVSYAVEQRSALAFDRHARNTGEWRDRRRGLLRFAASDGRLTGMSVLSLLYPSPVLAALGDPISLRARLGNGRPLELDALLDDVEARLQPLVSRLTPAAPSDHDADERWYWAAPILLDHQENLRQASQWFERRDLARAWIGMSEDDDDPESRWAEHVERAGKVVAEAASFGPPPRDLARTLALTALASPAVVALRALGHVGGHDSLWHRSLRDAAGAVAWGFRSLFNLPEATAVVRVSYPEEPYWQAVMHYAADGNLQAVLDEYAHLLRDLRGLFNAPPDAATAELADAIRDVLTIRTSAIRVDDIRVDDGITVTPRPFRTHFAMRFGVETTEDGAKAQREDAVRQAFNSPFRPFVLASTSIGQEGLDFHPYCHAVVHWNLPSNPVDLEQREGRVHRYKGHAVRKNVAAACGADALTQPGGDVWARMFELARERSDSGHRGLSPYWVFPGDTSVERHVPALPLSRDQAQLEALRRSLAIYRMVFGQPRQDDLMAYLLARLGEEELERWRPVLQIELAPPHAELDNRQDALQPNIS